MRLRLLVGIVAASMMATGCAQSDAGITTSVKSQLAADDLVQARRIDVDTQNRVVTLSGDVRSAAEEAQALRIARSTDGVTNVVDQLSVVSEPEAAPTAGIEGIPIDPTAVPITTDASITSAVKAKLLTDPDVSGLRINVDTNNHMVTLTGTVRTEAEKSEALQIARAVEGVTSVTDRLTVERRQ
jgi:hyperosmotically inducible protein